MTQIEGGVGESRPQWLPKGLGPVRDLAGLVIALSLLALAILVASDAISYPVRRSYAQFGPEIFPYIVAGGTALMGVLTVGLAVKGVFPEREEMNLAPVGWVGGAVAAQIVIIAFGLGFSLASGALFGLAARGLGRKPVWLTVAVGVAISLLLYLLFRHGLGLSLPAGPVEHFMDRLLRKG